MLVGAMFSGAVSADTIFVSNWGDNTIQAFDSTTPGVNSTFAPQSSLLWGAYGLAIDNSGNLYMANANPPGEGNIVKFDISTAVGSVFSSSGLFNGPIGLAFDSSGNLYTGNWYDNQILKIDSSGSASVFSSIQGQPAGEAGPQGVAVDSSGNIYVADTWDTSIKKFAPNGTMTTFATVGGEPNGLAFDNSGNLYVAVEGNNTIEKFNATGTDLGVFAFTGLNRPRGLAFDSSGNLFVANFGNNTIEEFNSLGQGTLFADTGLSSPTYIAISSAPYAPVISTPEPSMLGLFGIGGLALLGFTRRKLRPQ